ncbi:uncharacterized protein LOC131158566 isoform X2 [Malania oleifera]|uniref:uncharacterized protein LOC131158566 isoform X2 n=1 Tax=Malania oleifera TaxID=397392 RepID=UPI0025ADFD2A|nr:uncharacterized protein LOC131158566 isoform X2 [Malania oleifera]
MPLNLFEFLVLGVVAQRVGVRGVLEVEQGRKGEGRSDGEGACEGAELEQVPPLQVLCGEDGRLSTHHLQVLALRRSYLHRVLDYEDEFFALLMLVLETHSLRTVCNCHNISTMSRTVVGCGF